MKNSALYNLILKADIATTDNLYKLAHDFETISDAKLDACFRLMRIADTKAYKKLNLTSFNEFCKFAPMSTSSIKESIRVARMYFDVHFYNDGINDVETFSIKQGFSGLSYSVLLAVLKVDTDVEKIRLFVEQSPVTPEMSKRTVENKVESYNRLIGRIKPEQEQEQEQETPEQTPEQETPEQEQEQETPEQEQEQETPEQETREQETREQKTRRLLSMLDGYVKIEAMDIFNELCEMYNVR